MTFDQLKDKWQNQPEKVDPKVDPEQLLKQVKRNTTTFDVVIFWRDFREAGIALLLVLLILTSGLGCWQDFLLCFGCLFVAGFIIIDRFKQKSKNPGNVESLITCIKYGIEKVDHQIWLLKNVLWWYLLPLAIPVGITFIYGFIKAGGISNDIGGAKALLFVLGLCIFVYLLNQLAVKHDLIPRRKELLELLESLNEDKGEKG